MFTFDKGTPEEIKTLINKYHGTRDRVRFFFGDTKTGRDWLEEYDTIGRIGRSMGPKHIPLLIKTRRSHGGGGILTACIVRMTVNGREVYRHPKYHTPRLSLRIVTQELRAAGYGISVFEGEENRANFKHYKQGIKYIKFLEGKRNSK
jgi:hypothetical protein